MFSYLAGCVLLGVISFSSSTGDECMLCGPGFAQLDTRLCEVKEEAIAWLADQQEPTGSWPFMNVRNAIFGLQLANHSWLHDQNLTTRILTKSRLEYELLQKLLPEVCNCSDGDNDNSGGSSTDSSSSSSSDDSDDTTDSHSSKAKRMGRSTSSYSTDEDDESNDNDQTSDDSCCLRKFSPGGGRLGQYMLALQSVCCPVDDFYGVDLNCLMADLIANFDDNFQQFFQYSLAILSLCSQGGDFSISSEALEKLADGSSSSDPCGSDDHSVDILSMQVVAMVCARPQAQEHGLDDWETVIDERVQCILDAQQDDCSFGNAITNALAIQALTAAGGAFTADCPCDDTANVFLDGLEDEGFNSVAGISQILPLLNCNNFGSLQNVTIECPDPEPTPRPTPPIITPGDQTTTFSIKVDNNVNVLSYTVTILTGENLYYGMIRLENSNVGFTFKTQEFSFGLSKQEVNGLAASTADRTFWSLLIVVGGVETPSQVGISDAFPQSGDCYICRFSSF